MSSSALRSYRYALVWLRKDIYHLNHRILSSLLTNCYLAFNFTTISLYFFISKIELFSYNEDSEPLLCRILLDTLWHIKPHNSGISCIYVIYICYLKSTFLLNPHVSLLVGATDDGPVEPSDGLYFSSKGKKVSYTSILPMGALLLYYVHMLYYSWPKKFICTVFILFVLYIMYVMPVSVFEFLVVFILLQYFDNWPTPSK